MKQRALAAALAAAMALAVPEPASAAHGNFGPDVAHSLKNVAAFVDPIYRHKIEERQQEVEQTHRRQTAYRDWYYKTYGHYPTQTEFARWYKQTYGVNPQTS